VLISLTAIALGKSDRNNSPLRDVYPVAENSLYAFIEAPNLLDESQLHKFFERFKFPPDKYGDIVELFLWYGFLGIVRDDASSTYIYDVNYY
jgi:hypothetical protein